MTDVLQIQRILVPVDFSEPSKKAVAYGMSLALELDATLTLAHVVPFPPALAVPFPVEGQHVSDEYMDETRQKLRELIDDEFRSSIQSSFDVRAGDIEDQLLSLAEESSADLIVMGTHGRRRFERWFLGSVTEHILRKMPAPVLTVSHLDTDHDIDKPRPVRMTKVLYATDLSAVAAKGMETAIAFSHRFAADLIVLHVTRQPGGINIPVASAEQRERVREGLYNRLAASLPEKLRHDPRVRLELLEGVPYETILKIADIEHADLIMLNTQSRSGLDRALLGSTAERVIRGAHVPVLSVPSVPASAPAPLLLGSGGVLV